MEKHESVFQALYSFHYSAVTEILQAILAARAEGRNFTVQDANRICDRYCDNLSRDLRTILKDERQWILKSSVKTLETSLTQLPERPVTTLELRWLKSLLSDPRISLFGLADDCLPASVEPLYPAETFICFDRDQDGDPYTDETYIRHFRTILQALHTQTPLEVHFVSQRGRDNQWVCMPLRLEYSGRTDRFWLLAAYHGRIRRLRVSGLLECTQAACSQEAIAAPAEPSEEDYRVLSISVTDVNNSLERVLCYLSYLKKKIVRYDADENCYMIEVYYEPQNERDVLYWLLSFGQHVRILGPESLLADLQRRVSRQKTLLQQKKAAD